MRSSWFSRYILPGLVLKAAIIGGGYLSGRELEQYFAGQGPLAGLLGMGIAMIIWSCVYAATLEFARVHRTYEYRTFFRKLLGPGWILFEIAYVAMILTALSVFVSVAGNIFHDLTGLALFACEAAFMAAVAVLLFFGTRLVETFLSVWSFALYATFAALVILTFALYGDEIAKHVRMAPSFDLSVVVVQGVKYAGYNISVMTAVLFCARHMENRTDAIVGGLLGGPLAMLPGIFFFLALSAFDPGIRAQPVPAEYLLTRLNAPWFRVLFLAVMAITLLGTCCALVHAVNERLAQASRAAERNFNRPARAAVAAVIMLVSVLIADKVGLVALVDRGYGVLAWVFIATFMIPILTYGIYKIVRLPQLALG